MTSLKSIEVEVGGRKITIETGQVARQAQGAVLLRSGKTVILATVTSDRSMTKAQGDFIPLTVEYREKTASAGRIPGGFLKREARITEREVLACRQIDRSVRPFFDPQWRHETQLQVTVMSAEPEVQDPAGYAMMAAGAALLVAKDLPWFGPVVGCTAAVNESGELQLLPSPQESDSASLDFTLALSERGVVMLEGAGNQVPEANVIEALTTAQQGLQSALTALQGWDAKADRPAPMTQAPFLPQDGPLSQQLSQALSFGKDAATDRRAALRALDAHTAEVAQADPDVTASLARSGHAFLVSKAQQENKRIDGRGLNEVRTIESQVGWLPGAHGSALFTRGETQAAVTVTVAPPGNEQNFETLSGMERRRFLLHYNFPAFSVGEVKPIRGPGRRELGHGYLALRALRPALPAAKAFPFVLRAESDILESDGSSSMATICGTSLALFDAGVPMKAAVAGVAMGLLQSREDASAKPVVLTDLMGIEDAFGDMDFKVAGTRNGITAFQLDTKLMGLELGLLCEALGDAQAARISILDRMDECLAAPRTGEGGVAQKCHTIEIPRALIGSFIGPKGAHIKALQSECGVDISIDDDGVVSVFTDDDERAASTLARIRALTQSVKVGSVYEGVVAKVIDAGAFIRLPGLAEGWLHVSEWDEGRVDRMGAVTQEGAEVRVLVSGVDQRGRIQVSRRAAMGGSTAAS